MIKINRAIRSFIQKTQANAKQAAPNAPPQSVFGWSKRDTFSFGKLSSFQPAVAPRPQLSTAQNSLLLSIDSKPAFAVVRARLDEMRAAPGFKQLDEDTKVRVLQAFLGNEMLINQTAGQRLDNSNALVALVKSPGFSAVPASLRSMCITTYERAGTEGKRALAALGERMVNGQPALATTDSTRTTLAVRLAGIATSAPHLLDSTLKELAEPFEITAAVNPQTQAIQRHLASERPAELARLLGELAQRSTTTLADGKTVLDTRPTFPFDFRPLARGGSSPSEALFQRVAFNQNPLAFIG